MCVDFGNTMIPLAPKGYRAKQTSRTISYSDFPL